MGKKMGQEEGSSNLVERRSVLKLSAATLGSYGFSKTVGAQSEPIDLRSINCGDTLVGNIDPDDPSGDRGYYEPIRYRGQAGQQVTIAMQSLAGDTYLKLYGPDDNLINEDDDGGSDLDSRLTQNLLQSGEYTIHATSFSAEELFRYQIQLECTPASVREISCGETIEGELDSTSPSDEQGRGYYEPILFDGEAGQQVVITMESEGDTYLKLYDPNGELIGEDDDGGESDLNSELSQTLSQSGEHLIRATSFSSDATFDYTLSLDCETTSVRGTVTEQDGDPIEGATVRVPLSDGDIETVTNAAGTFSINFGGRSVPDTVTLIISSEGYATESVNVDTSGDEVTIRLVPAEEEIVVIDEGLHHLGDGSFGGSINSQFQEPVEGDEFETTFFLTESQASAEQAELVYTIRGAQRENELRINGNLVGVTDISDQDGSASSESVTIDPSVLQSGSNRFRAVSVLTDLVPGDIDDFEISNIRLRLSGFTTDVFDPDIHAFDFDNWPTASAAGRDFFNPPHNHEKISLSEIQTTLQQSWKSTLEDMSTGGSFAFDALAPALYVSINQGSATNGHCFGMVFTAQEYFNAPDNIPVDVESVDEIPRPTGEYSAVGDRIDFYQTTQLTNFNTYVRVKNILQEQSKEIDYQRNIELIRSAIEETGSAPVGVAKYNESTAEWAAHQLLAYDIEDNGSTSLKVYDPNSTGIQPRNIAVTTGTSITWRWEGGPYAISFLTAPDGSGINPGEVVRSNTLTKTRTLDTVGSYIFSAGPTGVAPYGTIRVIEPGEPIPDDEIDYIDYTDRSEATVAVGADEAPDIQFGTSGDEVTPVRDQNGDLYPNYDRLIYIGGDDVDISGLVRGAITTFIIDSFQGIASFFTKSPISLNVRDPDGEKLETVSNDFSSDIPTEYDDVYYRYNAPPGEYDVEVVGEGEGEYTVESRVQTANGGVINDSFTDTIQEGESKTLTATVPEQEGAEGSIFALAEFDRDDDGQIGFDDLRYAGGEYNRGNITFDQLRRIVRAYNTGESV